MEPRKTRHRHPGKKMLSGIKKIVPLGGQREPEEEGLQKTRAKNPVLATAALVVAGALVSACYMGGNTNKQGGSWEEDTASETDTGGNYDTDTGPGLDVDTDSGSGSDTDTDTGTGEGCEDYQPVPAYEYMEYIVTDVKQGIEYVETISLSEGLENNYMEDGHPEESIYTVSYFFERPDGNGIPEYYGGEEDDLDNYVSSHRVKIIYDGSQWAILGMEGEELELGKEMFSGIINIGESIPAGDSYSLVLLDTMDEGGWATAEIAVMYEEEEVCIGDYWPGQTVTDVCGIEDLDVHLYTAAPGLNFISKWAEVAVIERIREIPEQNTAELTGQEAEYAEFEEVDGKYYLREIVSYRGECVE